MKLAILNDKIVPIDTLDPIYFHITRGSAPRNHVWNSDLEPNFFLTVSELPDDSQEKAEGISVSTHPDWHWKRCDIKSLNLLANILADRTPPKRAVMRRF